MALSDPIPVRFSQTADAGLGEIASRTGLSKAELIRIATDEFLEKTNRTGEIVQRHIVAEANGNTNSTVTQNFSGAPEKPAAAKNYQKRKPAAKKK